jgi:hypothetical protein
MDTIKVEPDSEDETHPSNVDIPKGDTKRDHSDDFALVEVKCEREVGQFSEAVTCGIFFICVCLYTFSSWPFINL